MNAIKKKILRKFVQFSSSKDLAHRILEMWIFYCDTNNFLASKIKSMSDECQGCLTNYLKNQKLLQGV